MKFATNLTVLLVALILQYPLNWDPVTEVPNWCAAINDDTCLGGPEVPIEEQTRGTVKALYRQ